MYNELLALLQENIQVDNVLVPLNLTEKDKFLKKFRLICLKNDE